jgi:ketosteroid isomerase-like protein
MPGKPTFTGTAIAGAALAGAALATGARALVPRMVLAKLGRDLARLNAGDYTSLLGAYADDAVLRFHNGEHRWAGDWRGKAGLDRFFQNFTDAGLKGEIKQLEVTGPPWAMTVWVRFDDHADGPNGTWLYRNRTVLVGRARWGKLVEEDIFFADTERIEALDRKLTELGVAPVPKA